MTYLYEKRGPHYHWVLDVFARMGLPLFDGMREQVHACTIDPSLCVETCSFFSIQCTKDNKSRMQKLRKQKEERVKKLHIQHKQKCAEQSKRYVQIVLNIVDCAVGLMYIYCYMYIRASSFCNCVHVSVRTCV